MGVACTHKAQHKKGNDRLTIERNLHIINLFECENKAPAKKNIHPLLSELTMMFSPSDDEKRCVKGAADSRQKLICLPSCNQLIILVILCTMAKLFEEFNTF